MDTIDADGAKKILAAIAGRMEANRQRLHELDQVIGDGDLGITMSKGFAGAAADAAGFAETEPGKIFMKAGMAINKYAPSTMGTIMATGFMRGGKAVGAKPALDSGDFADFLEAFLAGVMERGKAKPGDKTVVDSIKPAAEAAREAAGKPLAEAVAAAAAGARAGLEASKPLMSQHGKSAVFREKTMGLEDPGSVAFIIMLEGIALAIGE